MDAESSTPETKVPVKVPEPADGAPPTLAEPASGPVAEMSGAVNAEQTTEPPAPAVPSVPAGDSSAPSSAPTTDHQPARVTDHQPDPEPESSVPQASEPPVSQDTEMKETTEPTAADAAPEANGTPAQTKDKGGNGKRKSSAGVPEHKNKKLNKKKSMTKITHLDAQPGDYFFARLKSYPPWPSIICDEEILPTSLLNTRPVTTKKSDGTYNEAYADGGKKVNERTFPVMFLFTNEFAWIPNTDLGDLNPEACKDVVEKGKAKALISAYGVASEGHDLAYFKNMLLEHAKAMEEDDAIKAEKAAEKADKSSKKKRKSDVKAEDEDVDMDDADDATVVKKSSKKRKKAAESDDEETEKPAKTPKTKLKLTTSKTLATSEKKTKEKPAKSKSEKRKSKAAVEDEEMADAPEAEPEPPMDPEEARKAREREVLFLRHKLQKGFLSRDQAPQEEDMPQMSQYIKKLENYEDLEVTIIRTTKINKVLKALVKLNTIPKDEEFGFRKRSVDLLGKWNKILGAEPQEDKDSKETPTTNGVHDDAEDKPEEPEPTKPTEEGAPIEKPTEPEITAPAPNEEDATAVTGGLPEYPKAEQPPAVAAPVVTDKAPESAEGAAVVTEVVKATE